MSLLIHTKLTCREKITPTYKHMFKPCIFQCETLDTPAHPKLDIQNIDINGGWSDSENLIGDGSPDLKICSDMIPC